MSHVFCACALIHQYTNVIEVCAQPFCQLINKHKGMCQKTEVFLKPQN